MNKNFDVKQLTNLGIFTAIIFAMLLLGIGFITPIFSPFTITTLQIPVIIGASLLGWKQGAILGGMFGLASFINNSFIAMGPLSFAFTPFYSIPPDLQGASVVPGGNFWSIVICFVPRIMVGVVAGLIFKLFANIPKTKMIAGGLAGFFGSLTNTILVLGGIFLFFGNDYSAVKSIIDINAGKTTIPVTMIDIILLTISTNGLLEIIASTILCGIIIIPLIKVYKKD